MGEADFWGNQEKAQAVVVQLKALEGDPQTAGRGLKAADNLAALMEMAERGRESGGRSAGRDRAVWKSSWKTWRPRPC